MQNLFTCLKVAGIAASSVWPVATGRATRRTSCRSRRRAVALGLSAAIGVAMVSTLFAYDGWHFVGFVAGEIDDPQRNVPRSIVLGVLIVIVLYVSANLAYIFVLGQTGIAASDGWRPTRCQR